MGRDNLSTMTTNRLAETASASNASDHETSGTPLLRRSLHAKASSSGKVSLLLQDWWLWELLSAVTATVATSAIVTVFVVFDGSALPDWPSVITINALISILAVIAKLSFTSAIGSSLSQSKWLWYRQDRFRPLQDIQLFDDASRGPWGALALIFHVRTRHLVSVGATITVLLLLFDPFLQQVVVYPDRLVPSDKQASIVRAQQYEARSSEGLPLPSIVDMSMKAAVYSGIFDIKNQADIQVEHCCATGNCTWDGFLSLAICSKCTDITSYIRKSCNHSGCYELSLPGGLMLTGSGGQINSSVTNVSDDLDHIEASVVQFSSLISTTTNNTNDATAWECAMFYCINDYSTTVSNGVIQQRITHTWRNDSASLLGNSDLLYTPPSSNDSSFRVGSLAAKAMNQFMSSSFTGSGGVNGITLGSAFSSDVIHALYDTSNYSQRIENLATSMTNNIRQQNDTGCGPFEGVAFRTETYVKIRWAWFSYPILIVASSLLYLLGTIIETTYRDVSIWKSNSMVMLLQGQGLQSDESDESRPTTLSEISEVYKNVEVKLVKVPDEGWKLVQKPTFP